jgi:hypothetical protein
MDKVDRIVLEITAEANGRQRLNKKLKRVRIGDGKYRKATDDNFDNALAWLADEGYELEHVANPATVAGTVTVRYIYQLAQAEKCEHDLPIGCCAICQDRKVAQQRV